MEDSSILKAISNVKQEIKEAGKKLKQSIDLVIILKPRKSKSDTPIDTVVSLPVKVKDIKSCAFVDKDLQVAASSVFNKVILKDDFNNYDKKAIRKLIKEYDFFFGEASIMPQIAAKFGKQLSARGKMPNPKLGTIITPASNLQAALENVYSLKVLSTKKNNAILIKVGDQDMKDDDLLKNIKAVYEKVRSSLPNGEAAIKHVYIKPTMGKLIAI